MARLTLIGIGQSFRGDDAVGIIAVETWRAEFPETASCPDIHVETAETPGIGLLDLMAGSETAILVDAVKSGSPRGTIHRLTESNIKSFAEQMSSGHGWGVAESLQLARSIRRNDLPERIFIIGIGAEQFGLGDDLSPEVEAQIPNLIHIIQNLINEELQNLGCLDY
jgi:hydrogenase maturation protease